MRFFAKWHRVTLFVVSISIIGALFLLLSSRDLVLDSGKKIMEKVRTDPRVEINGVVIPVELATTTAAIEKGLSGKRSLDAESGMLFLFKTPYRYDFWMPDMHFPIDIIWINAGVVEGIEHDVSNEFDPKNPKLYSPKTPVQYVLEVNAGFAKAKQIEPGDSVTFLNI